MNEKAFLIRVKILMFLWIGLGAVSIVSAVAMLIQGNTKDGYLFLAFTFVAALMIVLNIRRARLYRDRFRQEQEQGKKKRS